MIQFYITYSQILMPEGFQIWQIFERLYKVYVLYNYALQN
jgi:hypothetical protein